MQTGVLVFYRAINQVGIERPHKVVQVKTSLGHSLPGPAIVYRAYNLPALNKAQLP